VSAAEDAPRDGARVDVRRGHPTDDELAALIAVVSEAYVTEVETAVADEPARRSGWELSARGLREPLRRDLGWGPWTC